MRKYWLDEWIYRFKKKNICIYIYLYIRRSVVVQNITLIFHAQKKFKIFITNYRYIFEEYVAEPYQIHLCSHLIHSPQSYYLDQLGQYDNLCDIQLVTFYLQNNKGKHHVFNATKRYKKLKLPYFPIRTDYFVAFYAIMRKPDQDDHVHIYYKI